MRKDTLSAFRLFGVIEIDRAAVTRDLRAVNAAAKTPKRSAK